MKIFQPLCVAMLALSASAGNAAAIELARQQAAHVTPVVSDDSLGFQ